jgi:hypothetical protein
VATNGSMRERLHLRSLWIDEQSGGHLRAASAQNSWWRAARGRWGRRLACQHRRRDACATTRQGRLSLSGTNLNDGSRNVGAK